MAQPTSPAATPAATPAAADLAAADQTMEAAAEAANSPGVHANSPPTAAATGAAGGATPGRTPAGKRSNRQPPAMVRFADEHAGASTAKSPAAPRSALKKIEKPAKGKGSRGPRGSYKARVAKPRQTSGSPKKSGGSKASPSVAWDVSRGGANLAQTCAPLAVGASHC